MAWVAFVRVPGLYAEEGPQPLILARGRLVWDASRAARAAGVRAGQLVREAQMLCPEARVRSYDAEADGRRLPRFWGTLAGCAPCVEPLPDRGHEAFVAWPDAGLPAREVRAIRRAYPEASLGVASNRLVARLACPGGPGAVVVRPGLEARAVAGRPVDDLWVLPVPVREKLKRLGFRTAGQVAAVPEGALVGQLGAAALLARQAALGRDSTPVRSLFPPRAVEASRHWEPCLDGPAALAAASTLGREAGEGLARGEGARHLAVSCEGESGRRERAARGWRSPCADPAAIGRAAAALAAEAVRRLGEPVASIRVRLEDLVGLPAAQAGLILPGSGGAAGPSGDASRALVPGTLARHPRAGARRLPAELLRSGIRLGLPVDRYEAMLRWQDPLLGLRRAMTPSGAPSAEGEAP